MKDIVENRKRIGLGSKLKLGMLVLKENGLIWTAYMGVYYLGSSIGEAGFRRMHARAQRKRLPGINSATLNRVIWDNWDWTADGEEWTLSPEWKESLVRNVLRKYMPQGRSILEIGPGAGRWTGYLQPLAASLVGVDVSPKCVDICTQRFAKAGKARFLVTQGCSLAGLEDQSMDAVWSFDVFVHINTEEVAGYVREFRRVLRPGAVGVIHYGKSQSRGGWRSNLTTGEFRQLLEQAGFVVMEQFESWEDGGKTIPAGRYEDVITVFRRPG